jgi:hypothetical protein
MYDTEGQPMTEPQKMNIPDGAMRAASSKFAPKLSETERREVLALCLAGVRREVVADAYDIDRRTVGHIANPASQRYRSTRESLKALGHGDFIQQYLTEAVSMKVAAAMERLAEEGDDKSEQKPAKTRSGSPSKRANRMQGVHTVHPEQCAYPHRVEIEFIEKDGEEGWHFRDLDSETPDEWLHNGDESKTTSHACYNAMFENLMDD